MHSCWKSRGRGSLGFWPNSFQGSTWGCQKIQVVSFFVCYCIFCDNFSDLTPSPPPCVHLCKKCLDIQYQKLKKESVLVSTFDARNSKKSQSWYRRSIPETQKSVSLGIDIRYQKLKKESVLVLTFDTRNSKKYRSWS